MTRSYHLKRTIPTSRVIARRPRWTARARHPDRDAVTLDPASGVIKGSRHGRPRPSPARHNRQHLRLGLRPPPLEPPTKPLGGRTSERGTHRPSPGDRPRTGRRGGRAGAPRSRPRVWHRPLRRDAPPSLPTQCGGHQSRPSHPPQGRGESASGHSRRPLRRHPPRRLPRLWPAPADQLTELRRRLAPEGRIAVASQPRCPGATKETTRKAAEEIENLLRAAGFWRISTEIPPLSPPVVCVLATNSETES